MRKFLLLFVLTLTIKTTAQTVFLPNVGTKWHYIFGKYGPSLNKYNAKIEYIKDSIYMGENVKVLSVDRIYSSCNTLSPQNVLIKQRNDSIWFLHSQTNNTWQLLINFNAAAGQNWKFNIYGSTNFLSTYTVTVNSVSTFTINSISLKSLNVTYKIPYPFIQSYTTTINERLGNMRYLFDMANYIPMLACDFDYIDSFLCYEDSTFGLYQFTSNPCDYYYNVGINELKINDKELKIYPNPTANELNIEFINVASKHFGSPQHGGLATDLKIEIINIFGQVVQTTNFLNQKPTLNISNLQNGVYFLQIFDADKLIGTTKVVKK